MVYGEYHKILVVKLFHTAGLTPCGVAKGVCLFGIPECRMFHNELKWEIPVRINKIMEVIR